MRKMRKFNDGGSTDAEEAKYKAAGLAASNAENKQSSGFFGRLGEGNIDQKGSVAYEKYGAGYGRKLEAEKAAKAPEAAAPAAKAPAASAPEAKTETSDKSYDALESKRLSSPASKPDETPDKSYDALESKRLSSPTPTPAPKANKPDEDAMAVAASKIDRTPAPAAKAPAAKAPAAKAPAAKAPAAKAPAAKSTQSSGKPGESNMARATAVKPALAAEPKMERRNLSVPNATGPRSAANPMSKDPSQRSKPKYQSLQDRENENAAKRKESGVGMYGTRKAEESPRRGVTRVDPEDLKKKPKGMGTLNFAKGGAVSSRADGIAQRGKTRGRMC